MISLWLQQAGASWFGVAEHEGKLVATVAARTRDEAAHGIVGSIPAGAPHAFADGASDFAQDTISMLAELERGNEAGKRFELSPAYVPEPLAGVLRAAAAIPLGYVATYGDIAGVAGTEARAVGRIMATNPLYPIVPCHRVVGSDLSLVGYTGRKDTSALRAKLERLRAESRGHTERRVLGAMGGLRVYPVEWAIAKAVRDCVAEGPQLSLW